MRKLFPLVVLFAALISVNALGKQDLESLKYAKRISEALWIVSPANIVKNISKSRSGSLNRADGITCSDQVTLLQQGLMKSSMWALQMLDASSKIPSGILMGNSMDLGMFDECVKININEDGQDIRGRHCMYTVLAGLAGFQISETLSICLPASCEPEDVQRIVKSALEEIGDLLGGLGGDISISVGDTTCSAVDPPEWTAGGIVTIVGFSLLSLFLVVCTICDFFARYWCKETPPLRGPLDILRQFSLYSNAVRLLSTKTSSQTLPALQGLRFYSMCWVIIGHAYVMTFSQPTVNILDLMKWIRTWDSLYIMIAPFAVDSFFTISGFLMSYVFLKEMSTGRSFDLFGYYFHRYLRLTPAFVALILIAIFISPRLGSGPIWEKNTNLEEQACRNNWWTMIHYLHNYVDIESMGCLGHTWYLAVEMQFFWISPLILYPLARKPKLGLGILAAFFVASVATPVKIGYDNEYSTTLIPNMQSAENNDSMQKFYIVSHVRAAPWLVGIYFGYLNFTQKGMSASKVTKWIGWFFATAAFSFCIFTMRIFQDEDYEYDIVWESIYTAITRPLWGFAVSWVIYACVRGFGGAVSTFLSYPIYTPLSRMSYCIYLVHFEIQFMKVRSVRTSSYFSDFNAFDHFLSDLLLSIMAGFVLTLVFESPVLVLEKIIKKRKKETNGDPKNVLKEEKIETGIDTSDFKASNCTSIVQ